MWTQSKGRGHPPAKRWAGKVECRSGENLESGIRDNGLWCRALRQLRRDREVRQILESEREVTARREPGSTFLRRGEQSGSQAGKVTARREPRPTGRAKLPLSPIQSSVTVSLGQTSWADKVAGPAAGIFHCQIKCLTVIHLIRGCAVTTCNFHDALLERWTGGIDRPATRAKQRLLQEATESTESDSGNPLLGSTGHRPTGIELGELPALFYLSSDGGGGEGRGEEPRFYWISPLPNPPPARSSRGEGDRRSTFQCLIQWLWATGRCRRATRRAERGPSREPIRARLLKETASPFRSAGRRPARAGRPCYPFSLNTFN